MTTLAEICTEFQDGLEELEPADADLSIRMRGLVTRLAREAVEHLEAGTLGDVVAIVARCRDVLTALAAETERPEDRPARYRSRAAMLNLLILVDDVGRYHSARTKASEVDALRWAIADALRPLVEVEEAA